jgi:PTHB1 C-terminus
VCHCNRDRGCSHDFPHTAMMCQTSQTLGPQLLPAALQPPSQASPAHAQALSAAQGANALSFSFPDGTVASVLGSKVGGRYRLQSDCLGSLWLLVHELERRLGEHFKAAGTCSAGVGAVQKDLQPPTQTQLQLLQRGVVPDAGGDKLQQQDLQPFAVEYTDQLPLQARKRSPSSLSYTQTHIHTHHHHHLHPRLSGQVYDAHT